MTESEIARLSRREMTDLILRQEHQIQKLSETVRDREAALEKAKAALPDSSADLSAIPECGSIAEASLSIFNIFSSAQSAADVYLENIRARTEAAEAEIRKREEKSRANADAVLSSASAQALDILSGAQKRADELMKAASEKAADTLEAAENILRAAENDSKEIRDASVRYFLEKHREERENNE